MNIQLFLFWLSALVLVYTYVGYPLLIDIRARLAGRFHRQAQINPTVSILVVAHNEAFCIGQRIENLLALDYDQTKLDIVIASDGSSDDTVAVANRYRQAGVTVVSFERNRGKPAVLNELIPRLGGEIVVLMDARQRVDADTLRGLINDFAAPEVGAVSGELVLRPGEAGTVGVDGVDFYWRYEKTIRLNESRVDSTVGVTGALYAFRRELFEPIPEETLLDDVLIPMQIVRRGYAVLFEPKARASDNLSASAEVEFRRKVRTIAGNCQLFCRQPWLLNPVANRLWFQTVSHKFCRLLCPPFLVLALVANLFLMDRVFYREVLVLQILFYAAALTAQLFPTLANKTALLSVPHAFCLLNWSTVVGCYRFFRGQQRVTWAQTKQQGQLE